MALTNATLVRDVEGQPLRFPSVQALKEFNFKSYTGKTIFLESWHEGYGLGSGEFKIDTLSQVEGDDGYVIVANDGTRLHRIIRGPVYADMWGAIPDMAFDSFPAMVRANRYAQDNKVQLFVASGGYKWKGSSSLDIDQTKSGITALGRVRVDCTEVTADYLITIGSSFKYLPAPYYNNLEPALDGFYFFGNKTTDRKGLLCGFREQQATKGYDGQTEIRNCTFDKFDVNIEMGHHSWRFVFWKCNSLNAKHEHGILNAPAGLHDSGEILSFYHCQFFDGAGSNIHAGCASYTWCFYSCSFLNITFFVTGGVNTVNCYGCNFENPGSTSTRRYVDITAPHTSVFNIFGGSIVTNPSATFTQAPFNVSENNYLNIRGIKFPGGNNLTTEAELGYRALVAGDGYVKTEGCIVELKSGGQNIPIHKSMSMLENWNFKSLSGWAENKGGQSTTVIEAVSGVGPKGGAAAHFKVADGAPCFLTQSFAIRELGNFIASYMAKVVTAGAESNVITVNADFKSKAGTKLGGTSSNISATTAASEWTAFGGFLRGQLPAGTATVEISIRVNKGAEVYIANVLTNVVG